jgi:hypothetical protein
MSRCTTVDYVHLNVKTLNKMDTNEITEKVPEFGAILDRFKNELQRTAENSGAIAGKVSQLKNFKVPIPENDKEKTKRDGVIGELNDCIDLLSGYNDSLANTRGALSEII